MIQSGLIQRLKSFGPIQKFIYAKWAPSAAATQVLTEARGVTSITRSGAGTYVANLAPQYKGGTFMVFFQPVETSILQAKFATVVSKDTTNGTVSLTFKAVDYGSLASGPTATDTIQYLQLFIIQCPKTTTAFTHEKHEVETVGTDLAISYVKWNPTAGAPQTLTEAQGVKLVNRPTTGRWDISLARSAVTANSTLAFVQHHEDDTTNYHWTMVTAATATSVSLAHLTSTFAAATTPALSDTIDTMECLIIQRVAS